MITYFNLFDNTCLKKNEFCFNIEVLIKILYNERIVKENHMKEYHNVLTNEELDKIDRYFRAANYL